ncbi:glycosyltransferase family 4 protein [Candidatus Falkowbacteria bacterium]|nr:glycosyltransferase family 4 protein [Candidatus Falkowbacteria bacterium]
MNIAIDARMYGNEECTGIGTYIKNLTDNLFEIDKVNEYVLFLREPAYSNFQPPTSHVNKCLVTPRWYSYAEQTLLPSQFMKEDFDLIHYPHFNSPIFFPKKSVCTIHDLTPLFFPGHKMNSLFRRLAYRAVFASTLHKASKIIAVSQSTKDALLKHFSINPDKITIIYEGVDENFKIINDCGIINKVKNKFNIAKPFIFFLGVWRGHKNIEGLVKAFNLLKTKHKIEHQLVLAGREDLHYTNVRAEINASPYKNDIITTGYVSNDELPILYNAADAFVLPSFIEGFGLIAIEAQACGCPVISTNTTSMPEVLGDSALFFNPSDCAEMADKIFQVLTDKELKQNIIEKGLKNAKRFNWRLCAEQTLEIYNAIND